MARRTLTTRLLSYAVTIPAGTAAASPVATNLNPGDVVLVSIRLRIPPGPAGLAGVRFDLTGNTIVPYGNPPAWIIEDDYRDMFPVGIEVGNQLQLVGYNTDIFPHTFYGLLEVTDLAVDTNRATQLVAVTPA